MGLYQRCTNGVSATDLGALIPGHYVKRATFTPWLQLHPLLIRIEHDDPQTTMRCSKANSYTFDLKDQSFGPPLCFFCYEIFLL